MEGDAMTLVGCDLHARDQQVAVLDTATGEIQERHLVHDGDSVEQFYTSLPGPVTVGIESTGYAIWFHALLHRLGHEVIVGDAAKIRARWSARRRPIGVMPLIFLTSSDIPS